MQVRLINNALRRRACSWKYIVLRCRQQQVKSEQRKLPISIVRVSVCWSSTLYVLTSWPRCENSNQTSATGCTTPTRRRVHLRGCYPLHQQSLVTFPCMLTASTWFPSCKITNHAKFDGTHASKSYRVKPNGERKILMCHIDLPKTYRHASTS